MLESGDMEVTFCIELILAIKSACSVRVAGKSVAVLKVVSLEVAVFRIEVLLLLLLLGSPNEFA
jgi:hypothetical protein